MFWFEWQAVRGHTGSIENIDSLIDSLSLVNFRCLSKKIRVILTDEELYQ